jgi:uncharacterized protein (TIGR03663 family)
VITISSKSRSNKQASSPTKPAAPGTAGAPLTPDGQLSARAWWLSAGTILLVGAFLRMVKLSLVPLHHDEGVNGNFLVTLVRDGKYFYDPQNYHGPTLYYFAAVIPWLVRFFGGKVAGDEYGLTTFNIRLITVLFGIGTIWLALLLRKRIGTMGALCSAALIAISPGAVYLSRYFIHESLFVFFTLGIVVAGLRYYDSGRSVFLILASASAALMVATKETWIINGPVLLIALITTAVYFRLRDKLDRRRHQDETSIGEWLRATIDRLGGPIPLLTIALVAFAVFILVAVFFYSSFFTNYPKGVADAFKTLNLWRKRTHEHEHPWYQYAYWLIQEEGALMLLGAAGALIAIWRADNRLAVFLSFWCWGLLTAYSFAGVSISHLFSDPTYKTPWICLNFIVPLALVSGYGLDQLYRRHEQPWFPLLLIGGAIAMLAFNHIVSPSFNDTGHVVGMHWDFDYSRNGTYIVGIILLAAYAGYVLYSRSDTQGPSPHFYVAAAIAVGLASYQLYQLNFIHYDDDVLPYVYAHTKRQMLVMLDEIDRIGQKNGTGTDTGVAIVSPDYWPLPWYFRNFKKVGYYSQIVPTNEPVIIGSMAEEEQLKTNYSDRYDRLNSGLNEDGSYPLRPGVDLLLYVRRDVKR